MSQAQTAQRVVFQKSRPCFHCSKSLQQLSRAQGRGYVGFVLLVDGLERVFHRACVDLSFSDASPETDYESYYSYPDRIADLSERKSRYHKSV